MTAEAPPQFPMPSSVYGPVRSWRLGSSLGIDLIVQSSICSFNCVYCQLGQIQVVTREQKVYVPTDRVAADLAAVDWAAVDVVTFSGSGEPTLALNIGEVIDLIHRQYGKPTMILTNATMLRDAATRARVLASDTISCKLDAADDVMLRRFNRAAEGVSHADIVAGIRALRAEYNGRLALQCMFMPMNIAQAEEIAKLAATLAPDEIQVNTPRRPYPKAWYLDSRGNHYGDAPVDTVALKTITEEQAEEVERLMRHHNPGAEIVSVYRRAPK
ncbi:MAG: radical SAM protein [Candidatus Sumerlaeia bacterium]|nr:radical SAM protein [Candidatus Sumerlaeia bacterium]